MRILILLHTLYHLKCKQIEYQLLNRLRGKTKYRIIQPSSSVFLQGVSLYPSITKLNSFAGNSTFNFLNCFDNFLSWNDTRHGMLWAYNLNYMDYLLQSKIQYENGKKLIDKFIKDLPNNSVGLDPYPIALRGI